LVEHLIILSLVDEALEELAEFFISLPTVVVGDGLLAGGSAAIARIDRPILEGRLLYFAYEVGEFAVMVDEVLPDCPDGLEGKQLLVEMSNHLLIILAIFDGSLRLRVQIDKPVNAAVHLVVDAPQLLLLIDYLLLQAVPRFLFHTKSL
jgi:hypothetical protein